MIKWSYRKYFLKGGRMQTRLVAGLNAMCSMPNIDCTHCRAYAGSFGSAIARYNRFF